MTRALSTKVIRPVPREFIDNFVKYGQEGCEQMYGKRATARYKRIIGPLQLKRLRRGASAAQDNSMPIDVRGAVVTSGLRAMVLGGGE